VTARQFQWKVRYPGPDGRIVVGGGDAHPLEYAVAEGARGLVDGVGHQQVSAMVDNGEYGNGHGLEPR